MKRLKIFLFILICAISLFCDSFFCVYASGNSSKDEPPYDWSGMDVWAFINTHLGEIIGSLAGMFFPNNYDWESAAKSLYQDLYNSSDYPTYKDFLNAHSTYDSSAQSISFDSDALKFLNDLANSAKEQDTYQYAYFCPVESIDPNSFETKDVYDLICSLMRKYPDKAFSLQNTGVTMPKPNGEYGTRTYPGWNIYVFDTPYAGVSAGSGSITNTKTTLYDDNWLASFTCKHFGILRLSNDAPEGYDSGDIFYYNGSEWIGIHDPVASDFDLDVCNEGNYGFSVFTGISANYFSNPVNPNVNYIFSAHAGGIPIFKSVADMKAGTTGKQVLQTMPGYTGQPITKNTITQQEINDFSTTYNNYYGDNSGNNPGGGGSGSGSDSSGGNWLESLLSSLGKLGDIIMTLLSKVFDIITDILKFFTDTLADVMDIIPEGFIGFLGAFFPFIPKEWLTAVSLLLALTLIGAIIKFFKK